MSSVAEERSAVVIHLGEETVLVRVFDVNGDRMRFGIPAPRSVPIHREEIARRIQEWQEDVGTRLAAAMPQT